MIATHEYIGKRVRTPDGSGRCVDVRRSGTAIVEVPGVGARQYPISEIRLDGIEQRSVRCIHCGAPVATGRVCPDCRELLADLEDEPEAPSPPPKPARPVRGFDPSPEDWQALAELELAGAFGPTAAAPKPAVMPQPPRSQGRSLWGRRSW